MKRTRKQPRMKTPELDFEWAIETSLAMKEWQAYWFVNAPGVISINRKTHD